MNKICNSYAGAIFYAWPLSCTICVKIFRLDYGSYCNQAVPCVQTLTVVASSGLNCVLQLLRKDILKPDISLKYIYLNGTITFPQLITVQYIFEMFEYKRETTQKIAQRKCEK